MNTATGVGKQIKGKANIGRPKGVTKTKPSKTALSRQIYTESKTTPNNLKQILEVVLDEDVSENENEKFEDAAENVEDGEQEGEGEEEAEEEEESSPKLQIVTSRRHEKTIATTTNTALARRKSRYDRQTQYRPFYVDVVVLERLAYRAASSFLDKGEYNKYGDEIVEAVLPHLAEQLDKIIRDAFFIAATTHIVTCKRKFMTEKNIEAALLSLDLSIERREVSI